MIATGKDLGATALVGISVATVWANAAGADGPIVGSVRLSALLAMALGVAACVAGAQPSQTDAPAFRTWHDRLGAILGGLSGVAGLVAVIFGSQPALVAYGVIVALLWAVTTLRHLVTPQVRPAP